MTDKPPRQTFGQIAKQPVFSATEVTDDKRSAMTFDPKTHKFGMAYNQLDNYFKKTGRIIYPSCDDEFNNPQYLTRAPEHDLIPVAVADKLAEALNVYYKMGMSDHFDYELYHDGGDTAKIALTEYETYHQGR